MLDRDDKVVMSVRANVASVEQLKLLRERLQRNTPYAKVTMGDAFAVAVGSLSAAVAIGQPLPGLLPTQDRPPDRAA